MYSDSVTQKLLGLLQARFPLVPEPYVELGASLGITEVEVIHRIKQMKLKGLVRQISPVFDAGHLGYRTTLVAMRIGENKLDKAAGLLSEHPRVSHAYEREHHFNLWFILTAPGPADLDAELVRLASMTEAEAVFELPTVKMFKLRTYFSPIDEDQTEETTGIPTGAAKRSVYLSPVDRKVINGLQQDLPLVSRPFFEMSTRLRIDEMKLLAKCRSLLSRGVIRRFGASVNHRGVGFAANAMACWAVPEEKVEVMTERLVPLKQVSHCYERKINPQWYYNLFAMIHGHTREQCQGIADRVSTETGFMRYVLLFSTREFKKTRVIYRV